MVSLAPGFQSVSTVIPCRYSRGEPVPVSASHTHSGFALVMAWNCSLANGTETSWVGGAARAADVAGHAGQRHRGGECHVGGSRGGPPGRTGPDCSRAARPPG